MYQSSQKIPTSTPLVDPLEWDHLPPPSLSILMILSFVDGYLTDLPAGMFRLKPTMGGYTYRRWLSLSSPGSNHIYLRLASACEGGGGRTGARVGAYVLAIHSRNSCPSPRLRV